MADKKQESGLGKVITVVGNRPQFIKAAVVEKALREQVTRPYESILVNTGQHYDALLSDVFFKQLEIPSPHYDLKIGSGPIVDQIGMMLAPLRKIFEQERPDALLVYGDTNSTIAAAIAAAHLDIPVIHVEGGERLYRRAGMPEEVNRVVCDTLADLCLCSSRKAVRFLKMEGFTHERAVFAGDPMYDLFKMTQAMLDDVAAASPETYGLKAGRYILSTVHRAENTSDKAFFEGMLRVLDEAPMPVLLPAHPRLNALLAEMEWKPSANLRIIEPLGYFDFQRMLRDSALVMSDSGGVNREAYFSGKGCIIPLDSGAWTEAVEAGLAVNTGQDLRKLEHALHHFRPGAVELSHIENEFGDGRSGYEIVARIAEFVGRRAQRDEGPWHPYGAFAQLPRARNVLGFTYDALTTALRGLTVGRSADDVLVRIDVSYAFAGLEALSRIARDAGVRALFLVDPTSERYNLASPSCRAVLKTILGHGHAIGLLALTDQGDAERELALLATIVGHPVAASAEQGQPAIEWRDLPPHGKFSIDDTLVWSDEQGIDPADIPAPDAHRRVLVWLNPLLWSEGLRAPHDAILGLLQADMHSAAGDIHALHPEHFPFSGKSARAGTP